MAAVKKNFTVLADFEIDGAKYAKGDTFIKPDDWLHDKEHEQTLRKWGRTELTVFTYEVPVPDARGRPQRDTEGGLIANAHRVILPVE